MNKLAISFALVKVSKLIIFNEENVFFQFKNCKGKLNSPAEDNMHSNHCQHLLPSKRCRIPVFTSGSLNE